MASQELDEDGVSEEDLSSPIKPNLMQRLAMNGRILSDDGGRQQSDILVPETPSPSMPRKKKNRPLFIESQSKSTGVKLVEEDNDTSSGSDNDIPLLSQRIHINKRKLNGSISRHFNREGQTKGNSGQSSMQQRQQHSDTAFSSKRTLDPAFSSKRTLDPLDGPLQKRPKIGADSKSSQKAKSSANHSSHKFGSETKSARVSPHAKNSKSSYRKEHNESPSSSSRDNTSRSPVFSRTEHSAKSLGHFRALDANSTQVSERKSCMVEQRKADSKAGTSARIESSRMNSKVKQRNPVLSDDSTDSDTEPESHVLPSDVRPRNSKLKKKGLKTKAKKRDVYKHLLQTLHSDSDSEVELMDISSPERSPVFNRSGREIDGLLPTDEISTNHQASRNARSRRANRQAVDLDVVTIEDEIEEVIVPNSRRRPNHSTNASSIGTERNSSQSSFDIVSRLSGTLHSGGRQHGASAEFGALRSELGSPINAEHFLGRSLTSSFDGSPEISPSSLRRQAVSPRRLRVRHLRGTDSRDRVENEPGTDDRNDRTSNTRSTNSISEQQMQLEADEQLARDFASGRVRTPGQREKRISRVDAHSSRQIEQDEALARQIASGRIGTPGVAAVGEDDVSSSNSHVEDDEAMARRLQEQFNSEAGALEEPHHHRDHPDMSFTTSTSTHNIQINSQEYPFVFQYEFGMQSSARHPPYPGLPNMDPVVFGSPASPPRRTSRRRGTRARGRGGGRGRGRGRNAGFHIQFFPMDESLDDDYESLWELSERVGPAVQQGLRPEVLSLLPTFRFKPAESGQSAEGGEGTERECKNCTICMMDYEDGDNLRRLPCFHDYHTACIDRWLTDNSACPVCQTRVSLDQNILN